MKRLTERDEFGNADIVGVDSEELQCNLDFEGLNRVTEALNRLAEYEDTGLTPEQIREMDKLYAEKCRDLDQLEYYKESEAQGKLLKLPCALRDMVFDVVLCDDGKYRIFEMKVCNIVPFGYFRKGEVWNVYLEDKRSKAYRSFYDFGKTLFHTREEAEAALKRKVGNTE